MRSPSSNFEAAPTSCFAHLRSDEPYEAQFDLMYDDIDAAHTSFERAGFAVTEIEVGKIHRAFNATAPERFSVRVLDSHAGNRVV